MDSINDAVSMDLLLDRQEAELKALEVESKAILRGAKKGNRAELEAKVIQMEFDLKAKHREEVEELEEKLNSLGVDETIAIKTLASKTPHLDEIHNHNNNDNNEKNIEAKKAKAQRKKEKKSMKEMARLNEKEELRSTVGPSLREVELLTLNQKLGVEGYRVKEIISDGNCLYRAIADQMKSLSEDNIITVPIESQLSSQQTLGFITLRKLAASYIRSHRDDFAPFLGIEPDSKEFNQYCEKVESSTAAEWGSQIEIRAIANSIDRAIIIYDAELPLVIMGEVSEMSAVTKEPIRLTYHRHYFALGEHYNSVEKIPVS